MRFEKYADFDKAYGFSEKAGFQLSPLQITDVEQFVQWPASLNMFEVGGGKTVVSTVVSLMRGVDLTIVTVPPILVTPWVAWLNKVSGNVLRYQGTPAERKLLQSQSPRWLVVSHAIFRKDFLFMVTLTRGKIHETIVDEAHWLKSCESILFKRVEALASGHFLQLLTGTPISKPLDAYSYIKLKTPNLYRSWGHFTITHVKAVDIFKVPTEFKNLDLLRDNLAKHAISRTKQELHVYDLTPIFPDSQYTLSDKHLALYEKLLDERLLVFPDGSKIDATSVSSLRHALQQIVVNFDYFSNDPKARSSTYDLIDQTLEETQCHLKTSSKLIIWSKYVRSTAAVLSYCRSKGIETVAAYSGANTEESVRRFMDEDATRILVANVQSVGAGLNPQGVCSEALFIEFDPVPIYMRQAFGRLDRVGQKVKPRMRVGVALGTIQVKLYRDLMVNDDLVAKIEPTKDNIRKMMLGQL